VLRGTRASCGALALGMAGCSSSVQLPSLGGPATDQPQDTSCESLNAERARLLAERDDLSTPLLSSNADTGREAKVTELNGKLYTVAKAQFDKRCPAVANAPPSPPSAVVQ
jgi:hypothetical protein